MMGILDDVDIEEQERELQYIFFFSCEPQNLLWQVLIPFREERAEVEIPILAGYDATPQFFEDTQAWNEGFATCILLIPKIRI